MTYATLAQVKAALRIGTADTVDDALLTIALDSATEAISAYCGRTFGTAGTATATRYYAAGKADDVEVDDLQSITTVEWSNDGTNWNATTSYQAEPLNRYTDGLSWPITRLRTTANLAWPVLNGIQTVRITGIYAFGSVPSSITQAAVIQASRFFKRLDSPLGVTMGEFGALRLLSRIDPDVEVLLQPYRRFRAAL
jgi:hypothetical protein